MSRDRRALARHRLARRDGQHLTPVACCRLDVVLGVERVTVAHDDGCPALDPTTPQGLAARLRADAAVAAALAGVVGGPVLAVIAETPPGEPAGPPSRPDGRSRGKPTTPPHPCR